MNVVSQLQRWRDEAAVPRLEILALLPHAKTLLIILVVGINVLLGLLPVAFIGATSRLIAQVPGAVRDGPESTAFAQLVSAFLTAAACFVLQQILTPVQGALGERMKHRVDGRLRDEIMRSALQTPGIAAMEDKETLNALSEASRLFDSSGNTPGMACSGMLALIARYTRLAALLCIVAQASSWKLAVALGGTTLLFRYGNRGGLRKYARVWRRVAARTRRTRYLRELAMGPGAAKEMRVFGLIDWLTLRFEEAFLAAYAPVSAARREIYLKPYLLYTPLGFAGAATVLVLIASDAAVGAIGLFQLALGLQAASAALLLGEFYPESDMATQFGMQAVTALRELRFRIAEAAPGRTNGSITRLPADACARHVRFEKVSFTYPGSNRPILRNLELELRAGKSTAVVGANGVGKTTLVKLLTRLYEPTSGVVRAGDIDIASLDPVAWRRGISVVFQDFIHYELSAADNISFGAIHSRRDARAIELAAKRAGILDAFSRLPRGLDTTLARAYEGGIDLSGGQWQRLAIARALYAMQAGARILILDEPTSALDVRSEAQFFENFMALAPDVTCLLISHRFSSVRRADRIVVIDEGGVIEEGTHVELVSRGGHYARMFRLQADRFAEGKEDFGRSPSDTTQPPPKPATWLGRPA